jgi:hypothetical protein
MCQYSPDTHFSLRDLICHETLFDTFCLFVSISASGGTDVGAAVMRVAGGAGGVVVFAQGLVSMLVVLLCFLSSRNRFSMLFAFISFNV